MAINSLNGISPSDLYTTTGKDVWQVIAMAHLPTIRLRNLSDGKEVDGCVGSLNLQPFKRLVMLSDDGLAAPAFPEVA